MRIAGEYCKTGEICIPSDPQLEKLLKWYRKINKTKKWYQRYKKTVDRNTIEWRQDHPEKWRKICKRYDQNEKRKKIRRKRRLTLKGILNMRISAGISYSLRRKTKEKKPKGGRHWENLVGYSVKQLKRRLNRTMPKDYSWQDFMDGKLHIDHKIPISAFNFSKPEHEDFKRCWALKNLRLLPARENLSKSAKIIESFQPAFKI